MLPFYLHLQFSSLPTAPHHRQGFSLPIGEGALSRSAAARRRDAAQWRMAFNPLSFFPVAPTATEHQFLPNLKDVTAQLLSRSSFPTAVSHIRVLHTAGLQPQGSQGLQKPLLQHTQAGLQQLNPCAKASQRAKLHASALPAVHLQGAPACLGGLALDGASGSNKYLNNNIKIRSVSYLLLASMLLGEDSWLRIPTLIPTTLAWA